MVVRMSCQIEDEDGDWSAPVMLIMRGNSAPAGVYEDENGKKPAWPKGALHEGPAKAYAVLKGFRPKVLDVTGSSKRGDRDASDGTLMALECFQKHPTVTGFYGFSGGGYNLWHILNNMTPKDRARVRWVTVVGVDPDAPRSKFESSKFPGGSWTLDYSPNSDPHMFGPERLLEQAKRLANTPVDAVTGAGPIVPTPGNRKK
jgi:hypothetical protein